MNSILYSIHDGVAVITLNRPEKYNSFNREMALQFQLRLDEAAADKMVRCIYITGSGKAFCSGQDIAEVVDPNGPGMEKILSEHYNPIITKIREVSKPVLAGVNGIAAGAGANIALCCDITIATASSSFLQAFSKIGLIPDSGGTYFLPRLIGMQKATAFMMLGEKVTSTEAEKCGMIYKVFADDLFLEESMKLAHALSNMPTIALAFTKKALNGSFDNTLIDQLHLEDRLQQDAANTKDFKEGIDAFLAKRLPIFRGE